MEVGAVAALDVFGTATLGVRVGVAAKRGAISKYAQAPMPITSSTASTRPNALPEGASAAARRAGVVGARPGRITRTAHSRPSTSFSRSNEINSPSRGRTPSRGNAAMCTNTSTSPHAERTKPKPRSSFQQADDRGVDSRHRRYCPIAGERWRGTAPAPAPRRYNCLLIASEQSARVEMVEQHDGSHDGRASAYDALAGPARQHHRPHRSILPRCCPPRRRVCCALDIVAAPWSACRAGCLAPPGVRRFAQCQEREEVSA